MKNQWIVELTDEETEGIEKLYFKKQGLIDLYSAGVDIDDIIEKIGRASSELTDAGLAIIDKNIEELSGTDTQVTWDCDFTKKQLTVTRA